MPTFETVLSEEARFRRTGQAAGGVAYTLTPATLTHPKIAGGVDIVRVTRADGQAGYFFDEAPQKVRIVLHHTVGFLRGDIPTLTMPDRKVSVPYVVAGDGTIYELFDPAKWSYHLGSGAVGGNASGSRAAIGIELSSIGPLVPVNGVLHNVYPTDGKDYGGRYCDASDTDAYTSTDYRGYTAFATYYDAQLASLARLVGYLCQQFGIPPEALPVADRSALLPSSTATTFRGITAHVNYRTDKWDEGPWFPWDRFIAKVRDVCGHVTPAALEEAGLESMQGPDPEGAELDRHDVHLVQVGDTLASVADTHGTTVAELLRLNGLADPGALEDGMMLVVPHVSTYTVRRGDTLKSIAADFDTTVDALVALNAIDDPDLIEVGYGLRLPPNTN